MKTLTLKESQTLYEAIAVAAPDESIVVERNGRPVYVLVPYAEYQAQRAQRRTAVSDRHANRPENRTLEDVVADIKQLGPILPTVTNCVFRHCEGASRPKQSQGEDCFAAFGGLAMTGPPKSADCARVKYSRLVREPAASLAERLAHSPHDPDFNLEEWTREWAKIEAEMKVAEQRDRLKTEAEMRSMLGPE